MYQLPGLKKIPGIVHGFSELRDGNMSFSFGSAAEVLKNRKKFLENLGIKLEDCVRLDDFHGTDIVLIDRSFRGQGMADFGGGPRADAVITAEKNLFLFLPTGDCLPIIFYESSRKFVVLGHLSRMNTALKFAKKIVEKLEELGSQKKNICVAVGPGIRKESYVFSKEELASRISNPDEWKNFLIRADDGRFAVDLLGYNKELLLEAGIPEQNMEISEIDTAASKNFFSHYRSRKTGEVEGRMATVVGMLE